MTSIERKVSQVLILKLIAVVEYLPPQLNLSLSAHPSESPSSEYESEKRISITSTRIIRPMHMKASPASQSQG